MTQNLALWEGLKKMKVYVASSWRNEHQPSVVKALRDAGHEVYDFKAPAPGDNGFHWTEIDGGWKNWTPERFRTALDHPIARAGYKKDMDALDECNVCVLVMPCGRSAHLEAGFAIGAGKPTFILLSDGEPELMYKMARVCLTLGEVIYEVNNCCHYIAKGTALEGMIVPTMDTCTHRTKAAGTRYGTIPEETMPGGMF